MTDFVPYCGSPPVPEQLHWNLDPILISTLMIVAALYFVRSTREPHVKQAERGLFTAGVGIVAVALISPLCNLSVALFSARVTQHLLLTLMAAPLIVLGRPDRVLIGSSDGD